MSTHRHLAKSTGIIGGLTAVSRVLGFVRDLVIASFFGTGVAAEAFVVSFKIPNLLRDLVGEGATNAAFVPVLTQCHQERKEDFWKLVSTLVLTMTLVLTALSVLGICFAPWVVKAIAPGFAQSTDSEKLPLTIHLTQIIFPYILLIGLSALAMGVLNSLKEFTSSALGPCLMNLSMIAAGFFFERTYGPMALVIGVLAGGFLQLACQIPALYRVGFRFEKPVFNHPAVAQIGKLLIPRALGSALYQINVFVDSILASFETIIGPGGQSALYYSNRLFQLPLAIFGVSLAQAVLPTFSTQAVQKDMEGFKRTLAVSLRTLAMIILPAAVGLLMLSEPIVRIIFEHGKFDSYSTGITSQALFFYSFGLLSCCFIKIYANAFYALQDTRTPVRTALFAVFVNICLSILLMYSLRIGGLTLASSISATINVCSLHYFLKKRIGDFSAPGFLNFAWKIALSSAVMAAYCFFLNQFILENCKHASTAAQALRLGGGITGGALLYFACVYLLRVEELQKILKWAKR